jgi:hypothetical protein
MVSSHACPADVLSTIDPSTSKSVSARAAAVGASFVDAPVSGGTIGAEKATLTFMVGCDESMYVFPYYVCMLVLVCVCCVLVFVHSPTIEEKASRDSVVATTRMRKSR